VERDGARAARVVTRNDPDRFAEGCALRDFKKTNDARVSQQAGSDQQPVRLLAEWHGLKSDAFGPSHGGHTDIGLASGDGAHYVSVGG